jgi:lysozyme family protein
VSFESALALTLEFEGGFSDDSRDPGGRTMKGITQRTYTAWLAKTGHLEAEDVKDISDDAVAAIYRREYWNRCRCDVLKEPLATIMFDTGVNLGPNRAVGMLADSAGDPKVFLDLREAYYRRLVEKRPVMGAFLKGWLRRTGKLRTLLV